MAELSTLQKDVDMYPDTTGGADQFDAWEQAAVDGQRGTAGQNGGTGAQEGAAKPVVEAMKPPEESGPAPRDARSEWQKEHDRRLHEMLDEIDRRDEAKMLKILEKNGGKMLPVDAPAPTAAETQTAEKWVDGQTKQRKEWDTKDKKPQSEQHYEDVSALQKAILKGDAKSVQELMQKYKDNPEELTKIIFEASGLISGGVTMHYNVEKDGSVTLTVNTQPTKDGQIESIVAFSSKPGSQPYIWGHAMTSSLSPAAQFQRAGAFPGDLSAAETLQQIGNLGTARLGRRYKADE
ncbi:MAG: hypothetical protein U0105_09415 [Candidatus Obscuribacterales bacterium]